MFLISNFQYAYDLEVASRIFDNIKYMHARTYGPERL